MSRLNSRDLMDRQAILRSQCQEIVDLCKKEVREMTEEEESKMKEAKEEIKELKEKMEELKAKLSRMDEELPEEDEEDPAKEDPKSEGEPDSDSKEDKETKTCQESDKKEQKSMEKVKFNLMAELRSALETGKKINLAEINSRAYTVTAEGEDVVQTDLFDIWEPLRAKNVLVEAGAQYISGIKNNVQIPLMGAVSVAWAGELGAAADGSADFSKKSLSPKRITAKYPVSLELLAQDSIGVEAAIRADIIKAINAKLEATLLGADATANAPVGLFNGKTVANSKLTKVAAYKDIVALEAKVEEANVNGACKYVMAPKAKAALRSMIKGTNGTGMVYENGAVDGTPALATTHVAGQGIVYGDFSNLVIATWDNVQLDVVRDVASLANGVVTIVVNAYVDAALVREGALVFGTTDSSAA